jgi:hypothetical protein
VGVDVLYVLYIILSIKEANMSNNVCSVVFIHNR